MVYGRIELLHYEIYNLVDINVMLHQTHRRNTRKRHRHGTSDQPWYNWAFGLFVVATIPCGNLYHWNLGNGSKQVHHDNSNIVVPSHHPTEAKIWIVNSSLLSLLPVVHATSFGSAPKMASVDQTTPARMPWIRIKDSNHPHLQLEFSGRICTQIVGPSVHASWDHVVAGREDENEHQRNHHKSPLVSWPVMEHKWYQRYLPCMFVNTDYDFTKCWYGIRQLGVTFKFGGGGCKTIFRNELQPTVVGRLGARLRRTLSQLPPTEFDVTKEYPFTPTGDLFHTVSRTIIGCHWPSICGSRIMDPTAAAATNLMSLVVKKLDTPAAKLFETAMVKIPLHQRILLECHLFHNSMLPKNQHTVHESDKVNEIDGDEDWWIPNVRIDALGLMESKNHFGLNDNLGVTISLRRRLNWSALGWLSGRNSEESIEDSLVALEKTRIQFRVRHCNKPQTLSSMVEITSNIGQPWQTARLLFRQDVAMSHFS